MANYTKRKDGRYQARIYLGRNEEHKKVFKYIYAASISELKKAESELRAKLNSGVNVLEMNSSYRQWTERVEAVKKTELTANEYNTFKHRAEYFYNSFADTPLKSITQSDIQPVINELFTLNPSTGKSSSKGTLQKYIRAVSAVFEYAIEDRAIQFNPCKYVKIPKEAKSKKRRALSDEECRWIEETEHEAQTAAMLLLYSGLRRGEATALLWSDIDLEQGTISVTKSYDFKSHSIKPPKTSSGNRIVSIPSKLTNYLKGVKKSSIYVIPNPHTNGIMTDKAWKKLWDSYLICLNEKYGKSVKNVNENAVAITIEPFTPHCLRHTFCSIMYKAGIDVLTAKEQLGHSDIKTTLAIYTHLDEIYKKKNISKMDNYLKSINS